MKRYLMGTVKALDDASDPNGSFEVILSAPTEDRDGEIIDARAFDPLPDHITFDIDHGMSVSTTVGSGIPSYDDAGLLRVKGTFSSIARAQETRTLVREGHIRTTSVAFMDAKRAKGEDGKTHITGAELLNGAFVPIPSNREAMVVSAKEYAARVEQERVLPAIRKFAGGLSANDLRETLTASLRDLYGNDRVWVWVRDFDSDWVVFEVEDPEGLSLYRQSYEDADGAIALSGEPAPVAVRVTYLPADAGPQNSGANSVAPDSIESGKSAVPAAPETPADEAGKSLASGISFGAWARARAEANAQ